MQEQLDRIELKLAELQGRVDAAAEGVEKMRTYMLWGFWLTIGCIVVPLVLLPLFVGPFLAAMGVGF